MSQKSHANTPRHKHTHKHTLTPKWTASTTILASAERQFQYVKEQKNSKKRNTNAKTRNENIIQITTESNEVSDRENENASYKIAKRKIRLAYAKYILNLRRKKSSICYLHTRWWNVANDEDEPTTGSEQEWARVREAVCVRINVQFKLSETGPVAIERESEWKKNEYSNSIQNILLASNIVRQTLTI